MSHIDSKKMVDQEVGLSKHIPFTHLNSPTVVETKQGMILSVLKVEGISFQTESNETINYFNTLWKRIVSSLDETICIYVTMHRNRVNHSLDGVFLNPILTKINNDYMNQFCDRSSYTNNIYITILYRGINSGKIGKGVRLFNRLSDSVIKEAREIRRRQQMRDLEKVVDRVKSVLSPFNPTLLGSEKNTSKSSLLGFLSNLVNLGEGQQFFADGIAYPVSNKLTDIKKVVTEYPDGNLSQYLPLKRLFFGENIQAQGAIQEDNVYAGILSIKSYPDESASVALNSLMHLDCEWISTHTYAIESKDITMKKVKLQGKKLENVNDAGISQIDELYSLQEAVQTGHVNTGYHHHTLMIISDDQKRLDKNINQAARCYLDAGFPIIRESLGQEAAFWAQLPGNLKYIARNCMITSENFADFSPLHNYKVGYRDGNHLGSAVTLLETTSKTPYFFNFHKKGSSTEITPGHTTIIGSNGAGKTVLMTFLDAQLSRYHGRSVFFDRDRGAEIYIRAVGGVYSILSPDHPDETSFNPLLLPDTKSNRQFCKDWLAQLCKREEEITLDADILEPVRYCIDYAFEKLQAEHRQLSNIVKILPVDFERWPQLRRWIKGNGKQPDGDYSYIFDNQEDSLHNADKMGFDMTHFLDNEPPQVRTAVLMYLFHWIKSSLDGRVMAIWLDEAWQYFIDPYWEKELKKTLPTFRKLNAFLVMATQSASSVAESTLRNMILDNSATQIFFPNPDGRSEYYQNGFSLSDAEFEFIKENEAKCRKFLIKHGHDSVVCGLDLGHMLDCLSILSSDKKTIIEVDALRKKYGNDPTKWLPVFLDKRRKK